MNRFLKIIATPVMVILFVSQVHAGSVYQYSGVKRYYPSGENVYLIPLNTMINPAACINAYYYGIDATHPNFEEYKKLILSAKISGYKLGMYIYNDQCLGNYPKIYRIFIE